MCNAWNHPPGCACGWGGEGHLGGGGGWSGGYTTPTAEPFSYREGALTTYRYESSDFCRPTICPECGADVFFIRHNGGSVWVDPPLGWPWPKHGCFDDSGSPAAYRFISDLGVRYAAVEVKPKLGCVIKRIYRNFDHVYLIDTHEGRLSALSASPFERTVFKDLVAILPAFAAIDNWQPLATNTFTTSHKLPAVSTTLEADVHVGIVCPTVKKRA